MNHSVKVTPKGQMTLPEDILKSLQLEAGGSVTFVQNAAGYYELRPRAPRFSDLKGAAQLEKPVTTEELAHWIKDARTAGYRDGDE
jgi:bifunctional DNA-binding transcriptional regulator/antitoxin component of YhaV-PrlF toxin-antitoxin module